MILRPNIFQKDPSIVAAQSTRLGGYSDNPYASMNLGSNTQDKLETILRNKQHFCASLGIKYEQVAKSKQVHGANVLVCKEGGSFEGYDSLITNKANVYVCVSTADCVPILIYDNVTHSCAAIHAGWKGTKENLVTITLAKMKKHFGSKPTDCVAFIGPSIGECSFEVDSDVAVNFVEPFCRYDKGKQKYFIDLKGHNNAQLLNAGLKPENIEVSNYDTYTNTDLFYSHRKEMGVTGRMWTLIGLK